MSTTLTGALPEPPENRSRRRPVCPTPVSRISELAHVDWTHPVVHRCCRSAYPPPATPGVPPPPRTSPSSRLRRTSLSTYHHPHGARTASPTTPRPLVSLSRPRHRGHAARGDRATCAPGARAPPHHGPHPHLGWAGRPKPRATEWPSTVRLSFSILFIIPKIRINL
jgi:hypothetical protein